MVNLDCNHSGIFVMKRNEWLCKKKKKKKKKKNLCGTREKFCDCIDPMQLNLLPEVSVI